MKRTMVLLIVAMMFVVVASAQAATPPPGFEHMAPGFEHICNDVLSFENVQVGPKSVWAPTDKEVLVELSGSIVVSPGCEVKGFYSMESDNGPIAGSLDIEAGSFAREFPLMVSKTGKNKGGKTYQGTLSIEDEMGNKATQVFFVKVDHDRGENGERKPKDK